MEPTHIPSSPTSVASWSGTTEPLLVLVLQATHMPTMIHLLQMLLASTAQTQFGAMWSIFLAMKVQKSLFHVRKNA